jgi:hypothetical protein
MLICTKCNTEYEEGKKFCRNCGSPLVAKGEPSQRIEDVNKSKEAKTEEKRICPRYKISYESGKYCRKCGSVLVSQIPSQAKEEPEVVSPPEVKREEPEPQLFDKKSIKELSKEWLKLYEEKKKLEIIIKNLQAQRSAISSDVYNTTFGRYQVQFESLSSRYQQIETDLESVRKKTSEEVNQLIKEIKPIKKRLEEIESLHKSGAITKADFAKEKKELRKEINLREAVLKRYQQMISVLPSKMGGAVGISGKVLNLFRPLPLAAAAIIVLLAIVGYLLWPKYSYLVKKQLLSKGQASKEIRAPTIPSQVQPGATPVSEAQEAEKIKSLFENIRQANLQKNIDLFMSCYSVDFKDREEKRVTTLENWNNFNYLELPCNLISQSISGDTANARVEWLIRTSSKSGGQPQESRSVMDVELKKENGNWKIKEIKTVG